VGGGFLIGKSASTVALSWAAICDFVGLGVEVDDELGFWVRWRGWWCSVLYRSRQVFLGAECGACGL